MKAFYLIGSRKLLFCKRGSEVNAVIKSDNIDMCQWLFDLTPKQRNTGNQRPWGAVNMVAPNETQGIVEVTECTENSCFLSQN